MRDHSFVFDFTFHTIWTDDTLEYSVTEHCGRESVTVKVVGPPASGYHNQREQETCKRVLS